MKMKLSFHYVTNTLSMCTQNSKTWLTIITLKADVDELTPFTITGLARLK